MAEAIGDLHLLLRGSAEGLAADLKRGMDAAETQVQAKAVAIGTLMADGIKAGLAGIGAAIKGAINLGIEGLDRIDALDEAAGKVGLTYNAFQDLKYAAEAAGATVEALQSSLVKMQAGIASGDAETPLTLLKLDLEAIRKMEPDKQFAEIIDRLSQVKSTADKIDLTKQLFGKGGVELMNVINNGKAGLSEVSDLVQKLGGHLTEANVAMVGMANDNLDALKAGWGFIKDQIAVGIAPVLVMITKQLVEQAEKVGGISQLVQNTVDGAVNLAASMATVAQFLDVIRSAFVTVGSLIGAQVAMLQTGWSAAFELAKAGLQDLEIGFKQLSVTAADYILQAFNALKNTALKTLNDLSTEATVVAAEIAKALNPSAAGTYQTGIDILRNGQKNFNPSSAIPDAPTGDQPGSPSSLLFPAGVPVVDYTAAKDAANDFSQTAIEGHKAVLTSAQETGSKLTDVLGGKFWGDDLRALTAAEQERAQAAIAAAQKQEAETFEIHREGTEKKVKLAEGLKEKTVKLGQSAADEIARANQRSIDQFRMMNQDVVSDMVTSWATGTGKISDIISQWTNNMIRQFTQLALFGNKSSGGSISGLVGSLFGGLGSTSSTGGTAAATAGTTGTGGWASAVGSIFGGFFEKGGRPPMGKISVIGEDGPEFWMPDSAGRIIPNDQLASFVGGGGSGVSVDQPMVFNFHNYYQTGVTQADLAGAMDSMQDAAMAAVYEGVRRGGGYRKGMQG